MSPPFLFTISEIEEHPSVASRTDRVGNWIPPIEGRANRRVPVGVSGKTYFCDTQRIYEVHQLPQGAAVYKRFSVYFAAGTGFWVLNGDATTNPPDDDDWHPLRFDHSSQDYSSYLTHAGQHPTLRIQRNDQSWPSMLLPDIYHAPARVPTPNYGGLTGELPLFLALLAFSTSREYLPSILPGLFAEGRWIVHRYKQPIPDKRGVVVTVYTSPSSWANGSSNYDLGQYEHGQLGKYFN